jgi:hypothetical protein
MMSDDLRAVLSELTGDLASWRGLDEHTRSRLRELTSFETLQRVYERGLPVLRAAMDHLAMVPIDNDLDEDEASLYDFAAAMAEISFAVEVLGASVADGNFPAARLEIETRDWPQSSENR